MTAPKGYIQPSPAGKYGELQQRKTPAQLSDSELIKEIALAALIDHELDRAAANDRAVPSSIDNYKARLQTTGNVKDLYAELNQRNSHIAMSFVEQVEAGITQLLERDARDELRPDRNHHLVTVINGMQHGTGLDQQLTERFSLDIMEAIAGISRRYGATCLNKEPSGLNDKQLIVEILNVSAGWVIAMQAIDDEKTPNLSSYKFQTTLNLAPLLAELDARISQDGPIRPYPGLAALRKVIDTASSKDPYDIAVAIQKSKGHTEQGLSKGFRPIYDAA